MKVRAIRSDELPALVDLYAHLHEADAPLPREPELGALWESILSNPLLHYLVAEADERLVSSCTLAIVPNLTRGGRPYGLIENVVTHADYRRGGIATQVLHAALDLAWKEGCYKVLLFTGQKDPGIHLFYERAGFESGDKTGFVARPPEA